MTSKLLKKLIKLNLSQYPIQRPKVEDRREGQHFTRLKSVAIRRFFVLSAESKSTSYGFWDAESGRLRRLIKMSELIPNDSLNSLLAQTVKRLRQQRKLSQDELASQAQVDRTYISGIERARRNITIATLERLIPHLAPSPADFFKALCDIIHEQKPASSFKEKVVSLKP